MDGNEYITTGTVEAAMMAKSGKSQRVKLAITNGETIWAGLSVQADSPPQGSHIKARINESEWNGQPSYWIKNWSLEGPQPAPKQEARANTDGAHVSFGYVLKDGMPVRTMPTVDEQFAIATVKGWAHAGTLGMTQEAVEIALSTCKAAWIKVMAGGEAKRTAEELDDEIPWS